MGVRLPRCCSGGEAAGRRRQGAAEPLQNGHSFWVGLGQLTKFAKKPTDKDNCDSFLVTLIRPTLNGSEEVSNGVRSFPFPNSKVFQKNCERNGRVPQKRGGMLGL